MHPRAHTELVALNHFLHAVQVNDGIVGVAGDDGTVLDAGHAEESVYCGGREGERGGRLVYVCVWIDVVDPAQRARSKMICAVDHRSSLCMSLICMWYGNGASFFRHDRFIVYTHIHNIHSEHMRPYTLLTGHCLKSCVLSWFLLVSDEVMLPVCMFVCVCMCCRE